MRTITFYTICGLLLPVLTGGCKPGSEQRSAKAADYLKAGKFDEAKLECLNLLKTEPGQANATRQLGLVLLEQGSPLAALTPLLAAVGKNPGDAEGLALLARSYGRLESPSLARDAAWRSLAVVPAHKEALRVVAELSIAPDDIRKLEDHLNALENKDSAGVLVAQALLAMKENHVNSALPLLEKAAALDPHWERIPETMAGIHLSRNAPADALKATKTADDPSSSLAARLLHADTLGRAGDPNAAKFRIDALAGQHPHYWEAMLRLAEIARRAGDQTTCARMLHDIAKKDPVHYGMCLMQTELLKSGKDSAPNIQSLWEAVYKATPPTAAVTCQLARAVFTAGDRERARTLLEQAVALEPEHVQSTLLLSEMQAGRGDTESAIRLVTVLLDRRPHETEARLLLAKIYRTRGDTAEACAIVEEQLARTPKLWNVHFLHGLLLRQLGKTELARTAYAKASALEPANILSAFQLVDMDLAEQKTDAALALAHHHLKMAPGSADSRFLVAKVHVARKEWKEAGELLKATLQARPGDAGANDLLITGYKAQGKLDEALIQARELVAKRPDYARARILLAQILEKQGNFSGARKVYEELLAKHPDDTTALNNAAWLCVNELNDPEAAYTYAKKAALLDPAHAGIKDTLGWVLYHQGQYREARALFLECIEKDPGQAGHFYHLGMVLTKLGDTEGARSAFTTASSMPGDLPEKALASTQLGNLDPISKNNP